MKSSSILHLVLLGAVVAGCATHADDDERAPEPIVPVRVAGIEPHTFEDVLQAPGAWRSAGDLVVSAPFAAVVESVSVRDGDEVREGQTLGVLVTAESFAALEGAKLLGREARDEAGRDEARRALELARRDLVRVPLTAPQSGVVVRRSAEPGARIQDAAEVLAIVPWSALVFEAHVASSDMVRVRVGEPATVRAERGAPRDARVARVLPSADPNDQSTLVWLAPVTPRPPPALGQFGTAAIVAGPTHTRMAVPDSAVVEDDLTGEQRVAVVDSSGRAVWTPVLLGAAVPGWHELLQPELPAGTRVVVEGQRGLPDSTRVTPTP
jgi:multidrug efflux pump subunit AcrA (membrane-fusion protein)